MARLIPARPFSAAGLLAMAAFGAPLAGQEYQVDLEADRQVVFISQTTLEEFEGVTSAVDGFVYLPDGVGPDAVLDGSRLYFEVDLASIDTGVSLRNRHMRDNYLETSRFPYATFEASIAEIARNGEGLLVTTDGELTIHGVSRERRIRCAVTADGSPGYRVGCRFAVRLGDHDISIPQVMFLKLAEEVTLDLAFVVRRP
jgi:polyisoprenoid-binding protein YceI